MVMYKYMINYFNTFLTVYDQNPAKQMQFCTKEVHGKSWRHRTRLVLHGGVIWRFPAPEVKAESLVHMQEKLLFVR